MHFLARIYEEPAEFGAFLTFTRRIQPLAVAANSILRARLSNSLIQWVICSIVARPAEGDQAEQSVGRGSRGIVEALFQIGFSATSWRLCSVSRSGVMPVISPKGSDR